MNFTDEQLERYSRHIVLQNIGIEGQERIREGKVLIAGTGGLGSPAALYLAAAGVGTLGLADGDRVELSNLQRQIIHSTPDIGKPKVISAREKLEAINPDVRVIMHREHLFADNIAGIIREYDFVIDGTDNFAAKFLINDASVFEKKPFSHGGIYKYEGQTLTHIPGEGCYRCLFDGPPPGSAVPSCSRAGVLGALAGMLGTIQAVEALKYLTGEGDLLTNRLLAFDAFTMSFRTIAFKRNPGCPVCGENPVITELTDEERPLCDPGKELTQMKSKKEIRAEDPIAPAEFKKAGIIRQKQKGLFAMRLRTVGGDLSTAQLREIAGVSDTYADGEVHLSTRQGVEIHNIKEEDLGKAKDALNKAGIKMGACGPRIRVVTACPGSATCRWGIIDTKDTARKLDGEYFGKETPSKFKIAVTGCPHNCAKATENDIGVMGAILPGWDENGCTQCDICVNVCPGKAIYKDKGRYKLNEEKCIHCSICTSSCPASSWKPRLKGYSLFLGGTMGKIPRLGTRVPELIDTEERLMALIQRAVEYYRNHGRKKERSGHMMDRIGEKDVIKEIMDEF